MLMQRCLRCSLKTVVLNYEKEDFKNFCKVEKYVVKKLTHKKIYLYPYLSLYTSSINH